MVETITPVVHGGKVKWLRAWTVHVVSATGTAALTGALLAAIGRALGAPWGALGPAAIALVAFAYLVGALVRRPLPVPQARRQVPEWWRTFFGPTVAAALYGGGLGIGFATYLPGAALLVAAMTALASGGMAAGAVIFGVFGCIRGAAIGVVGRARTPSAVAAVAERVAAFGASALPRIADRAALALVAVAGAVAARSAAAGSPARFASAVIALTMGAAAAMKVARPATWRATIEAFALGGLGRVAWVAVPTAEALVLALAVLGHARAAALLALVLLGAFSLAAVSVHVRSGRPVPCGCFGSSRSRSLPWTLTRNAFLAALAVVALRSGSRAERFVPVGLDVLPITLLFAGLCAIAFLGVRVGTLGRDRG
jgi:hypothetical protein